MKTGVVLDQPYVEGDGISEGKIRSLMSFASELRNS
jgi:hypothetical protein